jgi:hypothetical protein
MAYTNELQRRRKRRQKRRGYTAPAQRRSTRNHAGGQSGRHPQKDRGLDSYPTPPEAVEALLKVEQLPHRLWEPAAGHGPIVQVLRDHGHAVIASDIKQYDFPLDYVGDFLDRESAPPDTNCILTNPPFSIINKFVANALDLVPKVVILAQLTLLSSEARTKMLERRGLARVHIFRNRLPMMHREGWAGPKASSMITFAWFVWERGHESSTTLHRTSWERNTAARR